MNPDIHVEKLQYALKHLGRAAVKIKERQLSRKDLSAKFQKVKSSAKKGKEVSGDIEDLENVLRQVLRNERDMLEQQKRYADLLKEKLEDLSPDLDKDLKIIKKRLNRNLEAENLHAAEYKNKIDQLTHGLSEVERDELVDIRYNREQLDKVNRGMSDLRQKMGDFSPERIDLLEKRIRSDVQKNRKQLLLIEQEIRHLERKSKELKKKGISKEALGKVDEKIEVLKEKSKIIKKKYPSPTAPKKIDIVTGKEIKESSFKQPREPRRRLNLDNVDMSGKKVSEPLVRESKKPWRPPKLDDVKKEIQTRRVEPKKHGIERKDHQGISEIMIPKRVKPRVKKGAAPRMPPKPSIDDLQKTVPEPPKAESTLPKFKPVEKDFDMPPEFETPKKVSVLKKIKDWFGL